MNIWGRIYPAPFFLSDMNIEALSLTLLISFFTITGMILISGVIYISEKDERQKVNLEYWVASGAYFLASIIVSRYESPVIYALPTLIWAWRVITMRKILNSVSRTDLYQYWHTPLILAAYVLSASLALGGYSFVWYTLPQAIANFTVVMSCLLGSHKLLKRDKISINHWLLFFSIFLTSAHSLDFPWVRFHPEFSLPAVGILLFTNILMAIVLPAVTIYEMKREQEKKFEELLRGQSRLSALGEMTRGIAHEINNPLGIILHRTNYLRHQVLNDNVEKDALVRNLDHIEATSERMNKLIRSLRNYSSDANLNPLETIKLKKIIDDTLCYCKDRFRLHAIDLIVEEIPDDLIECRPDQISQVILNLLNNSFDAVAGLQEKWVRLSFEKKESSFVIVVTDSGPKIPLKIIQKWMKDFSGAGLGLSISKDIIEEHQGKLIFDEFSPHKVVKAELPYNQNPIRYSQSS